VSTYVNPAEKNWYLQLQQVSFAVRVVAEDDVLLQLLIVDAQHTPGALSLPSKVEEGAVSHRQAGHRLGILRGLRGVLLPPLLLQDPHSHFLRNMRYKQQKDDNFWWLNRWGGG